MRHSDMTIDQLLSHERQAARFAVDGEGTPSHIAYDDYTSYHDRRVENDCVSEEERKIIVHRALGIVNNELAIELDRARREIAKQEQRQEEKATKEQADKKASIENGCKQIFERNEDYICRYIFNDLMRLLNTKAYDDDAMARCAEVLDDVLQQEIKDELLRKIGDDIDTAYKNRDCNRLYFYNLWGDNARDIMLAVSNRILKNNHKRLTGAKKRNKYY